ncbi:hypothetical protein [Kitasatospora purpeofusca]|uniref:hypothetical protein n=1 Tax=Kitasatospora purpeofusca TaxID=67352 RepID=UPI0037F9C623
MRRTTLALAAVGLALTATGCGSSGTDKTPASAPAATTPAAAAPASTSAAATAPAAAPSSAAPTATKAATLDASTALAALTKAVPSITLVKTYTAEDDPNKLLGRPNQYTSKIAFADSRIKAADVEGQDADAINRGGSIEVFATAADATARLTYMQSVIKALPLAVEYDYVVRDTVLIRASHLLTPTQATALEAVLKG